MPLYEYECEACSHRFEKIQKFSDAPIQTCPVCGGQVRKLPSSPAIQFKGSGWYINDYARAGKGDAEKAPAAKGGEAAGVSSESSPDSSSKSKESSSDGKSESKSASKSESKTSKTESAPATPSAAKDT